MSRARELALAGCACGALLSSCVGIAWTRAKVNAPIAEERVAALAPGRASLSECLGALGAPLDVWELPQGGCALAWGWSEQRVLGAHASIDIARGASASYQYEANREQLQGFVLFFDRADVLSAARRGCLDELVPKRKRPAPPEDEAGR